MDANRAAHDRSLYLHTPNVDFFMERAKQLSIVPQFPEHITVRDDSSTADLLVAACIDSTKIAVETIAHYNILKLLIPRPNCLVSASNALPGSGESTA